MSGATATASASADGDGLGRLHAQAADVWRRLLDEHESLLAMTVEEYGRLLGNEMERLEETVREKEAAIGRIGRLEGERRRLIDRVNDELAGPRVINARGLLFAMRDREARVGRDRRIETLNAGLVGVIGRIRAQNRKNLAFIDRASRSLRELKEDIVGRGGRGAPAAATYDARGTERPWPTRSR